MKLGFKLRKLLIETEMIARRFSWILDYLAWLLFDPNKFVRRPLNIKKVLVVDISATGDSLNTFCLTEKAAKKYPKANFFFLSTKSFSNLIKSDYRTKSIAYEDSPDFLNKLKKLNFDLAILIHSSAIKQSQFSFINYRVGSELEGIRGLISLDKFFLSRKISPLHRHKVLERFKIFELAGFKFDDYKLELPPSRNYRSEAEKIINKLNLKKTDKVIFFNPSAVTSLKARKNNKVPSHDWPLKNFSELANLILKDTKTKILITGTGEDKFLADEIIRNIQAKNQVKSLCGMTSYLGLGELMRIFNRTGFLVTLDTGTVPLGTSANIKLIDLMGPYDPKLYCAWNPSPFQNSKARSIFHPQPCSKCRKYYCPEENPICMNSITVQEVLETLNQMRLMTS